MKKYVLILFSVLPLFIMSQDEVFLKKVIQHANPDGSYKNLQVKLRVQEPRLQNHSRFSIIDIDLKNNRFSLIRNREDNISEHIVNERGESNILFNGSSIYPDSLKQKYSLDPARNAGYRQYYEVLYRLPMVLADREQFDIIESKQEILNNNSYKVYTFKLADPMFSDYWKIYFDEEDLRMERLVFHHPDDLTKGEYMQFDGEIILSGMTIPRFRHWHSIEDDSYLGSDIIINEME